MSLANSLLTGETDLSLQEITQGQSWDAQILGAYKFLFPYIAKDFRLILDCDTCHEDLFEKWMTPGDGIYHTHKPFLLLGPKDTSNNFIDKDSRPNKQTGGRIIDTFNA